mmetsp:Transcript_29711/g.36182  ORF Transcript_29711/g.36182 Transcript_29711/m.36182 type:complete len:107 (-) Transcript_29711:98-418(-)
MIVRRSLAIAAKHNKNIGRTIVCDPRKKKSSASGVAPVVTDNSSAESLAPQHQHQLVQQKGPLPFVPDTNTDQQQSLTSSLGSYMLAGAGVALGFTLVGAIFGGIG